MSRENVEVRQPVAVRSHSRRRPEERLALRFPRAAGFVTGAVLKASPHSWLRQALLRHFVRVGIEAVNRGDYESTFALHAPDIELNSPPEMIGLGEAPVTRGREERVRFQRSWNAQWGEIRFQPEELIDLGDGRVLVIGRMKGSGLSSGAGFDNEWANLITLSAGRVVREQVFRDHGEALEAAGLSE